LKSGALSKNGKSVKVGDFGKIKGRNLCAKKGRICGQKPNFGQNGPKSKPNEENVQKRKKKEISKSLIIYCE
jgi:hypothetical protein